MFNFPFTGYGRGRFVSVSVLTSTLLLGPSVSAQTQPNVILILTDDQGTESLEGDAWPNHMQCDTPTLSRLSDLGVSFTQLRVNPNCSPTRGTVMTGRYALDTGVVGVLGRYVNHDDPCLADPLPTDAGKIMNRMALQTHERTLAEVLDGEGYYTILADKWHLGYNEASEDRGLLPTQQGFDRFYDWYNGEAGTMRDTICDDDPEVEGDEHLLDVLDFAIDAVGDRGSSPYFLVYATTTPHRLHTDSGGYHWWKVDDVLADNTYDPNPPLPNQGGHANRFVQNVDALDTILERLLFELEVIEDDPLEGWVYIEESNTVVLYMSDNGTDSLITEHEWSGVKGGKNTLHEGGINVPLFAFGEGISEPANPLQNTIDPRQVSGVDLYETICDIAGATSSERSNGSVGNFPRRGMSFADSIGWSSGALPEREFTLCSLVNKQDEDPQAPDYLVPVWRVALIWDHYKLVCNGHSWDDAAEAPGLDSMTADEFYDLDDYSIATAPVNLLDGQMTQYETDVYWFLRDRLVDHWPSAVSKSFEVDDLLHYTTEHYDANDLYVYVMHVESGSPNYTLDEFYDLFADPNRTNNLVGQQMTNEQQQAYVTLKNNAITLFNNGFASPDIRTIDVPLIATLVQSDDSGTIPTGPLTLGHANGDGTDPEEFRALLKFDLDSQFQFPEGFTIDDVSDAQIIVAFKQDSEDWDTTSYMTNDTDTGVISIRQWTASWGMPDLFEPLNYGSVDLGAFDPPAHIIPDTPGNIRGTPMPAQNAISFGHNQDLLNLVEDWYDETTVNNGVILFAEELSGLIGNQHVNFFREAKLRLTLQR